MDLMAPGGVVYDWLAASTTEPETHLVANPGWGPVKTYQHAVETYDGELLGFIHDDVIIRERGWDEKVVKLFDNPRVGVVGFGGAVGHGTTDIYKRPYQKTQLQRIGYCSNVDDAEVHGAKFTGEKEVAVLDGFALFTRRELLDKAGGWPTDRLVFHCYDYWLCCVCHRLGYQVWMTGVQCYHMGGQTSTKQPYNTWLRDTLGKTDDDVHSESHVFIYNEFSDVLPWRV